MYITHYNRRQNINIIGKACKIREGKGHVKLENIMDAGGGELDRVGWKAL